MSYMDEDLIFYFKCTECDMRCCKDEFDKHNGICIYCLNKRLKVEQRENFNSPEPIYCDHCGCEEDLEDGLCWKCKENIMNE